MSMLLMYIKAFVVGGILCAIGQVLILKTQLTSARILVGYVTTGVILGALGFGYSLARGSLEAVKEIGVLGAFTGGITATAGGISAAIFFGYLAAVLFKPKMKA